MTEPAARVAGPAAPRVATPQPAPLDTTPGATDAGRVGRAGAPTSGRAADRVEGARVDALRGAAPASRADAIDRLAEAYVAGARDRAALGAWLRDHRADWARVAGLHRETLAAAVEARLEGRVARPRAAGARAADAVAHVSPGLLREAVRREADARLQDVLRELAQAAARPGALAERLARPGDPEGSRWRARLGLSGDAPTVAEVQDAVARAEADAHAVREHLMGQRWLPADVPASTRATLARLRFEDAPDGSFAGRAIGDRRDRWVHAAVHGASDSADGLAGLLRRVGIPLPAPVEAARRALGVAALPARMADDHLRGLYERAVRLGL